MNLNRRLGFGALLCGFAAALAGSPYRRPIGQLDVEQAARVIEEGTDHIGALELAAMIRARKPGLRVIDVRSPQAFAQFAIPTAENLPLDVLLHTRFAPNELVVLYSEEGAHAGQAWALLRALGVHNVWFIAGGLADWRDEVLAPVLPRNATPQEALAFEATAQLSRYFGGNPTIGEPMARAQLAASAAPIAKLRRRGC
ncbi:MAG: rhodanese-like domain-containing protein [Pseudomonadota bacterium]